MTKIIKSNLTLSLIIFFTLAVYIHLTIGDLIATSLIYVWYLILAIMVVLALCAILYGLRVLVTKWQIKALEAQIMASEVQKAQRDIRTFERGMQVYQFGVLADERVHALHLDPNTYSNGLYVVPTQEQLAIFNQYNQTYNQQNNYYSQQEQVIDDSVPLLEAPNNDTNWIDDLLLSPHIHLAGPTGSGKTTFARVLIDKLISTEKGADFWLIDPKNIASKTRWPIDPFVKDIDQVESALTNLVDRLNERKNDPAYDAAKDPDQIIIFDDWDFAYEYGKMNKSNLISILLILLKVGREVNFRVVLIGQSTLSMDTGLSQSSFNNLVSVILGRETYQAIKQMRLSKEEKQMYRDKLAGIERQQQRQALVIPAVGAPMVRVVPDLSGYIESDLRLEAPATLESMLSDEESAALEAFEGGKSLRECARLLTGKKQKLINSSDTEKVKSLARQHGLERA